MPGPDPGSAWPRTAPGLGRARFLTRPPPRGATGANSHDRRSKHEDVRDVREVDRAQMRANAPSRLPPRGLDSNKGESKSPSRSRPSAHRRSPHGRAMAQFCSGYPYHRSRPERTATSVLGVWRTPQPGRTVPPNPSVTRIRTRNPAHPQLRLDPASTK
jgi:hypothetical protein